MAIMKVEVVYALGSEADCVSVSLPAGATLREAIAASGLLERHPEIDLSRHKLGVHGELKAADAALRDGARVEIYRALAVDPKEARRLRARSRRR
jgi:hypothetical protein